MARFLYTFTQPLTAMDVHLVYPHGANSVQTHVGLDTASSFDKLFVRNKTYNALPVLQQQQLNVSLCHDE